MTYIPSEQQEDEAHGCFPRFPVSGLRLGCFTSWCLFPSMVDKSAMSSHYNPLILPSTSHTGDLGMHNSSMGSQEVNLP